MKSDLTPFAGAAEDAVPSPPVHVLFAGGGTGGHLYPALAIARALVRARPQLQPFFIGARRGIERDVLPGAGFPFELLDLHPLYRSSPWKNWRTIAGAWSAWRRLAAITVERPPAALVATGGYVAGVALAYASRKHIPIVIQEQNSFPGLTVRRFAGHASQIHLGFPEAAPLLRLDHGGPETSPQLFDSGNPVELPPVPRPDRNEALAAWGFSDDIRVKTLLVFGGSQGAEAINRVVGAWITGCGAKSPGDAGLRIIWVTGPAAYQRYRQLDSESVRVRPYIAPMASAYAAADLALSRAGAMTTAELAAWGIPAVLVPLPTAAADHQTANAKALAASGAARVLPQESLTVAVLEETVAALVRDEARLKTMQTAALKRARPDAADRIVKHILMLIDLA